MAYEQAGRPRTPHRRPMSPQFTVLDRAETIEEMLASIARHFEEGPPRKLYIDAPWTTAGSKVDLFAEYAEETGRQINAERILLDLRGSKVLARATLESEAAGFEQWLHEILAIDFMNQFHE